MRDDKFLIFSLHCASELIYIIMQIHNYVHDAQVKEVKNYDENHNASSPHWRSINGKCCCL